MGYVILLAVTAHHALNFKIMQRKSITSMGSFGTPMSAGCCLSPFNVNQVSPPCPQWPATCTMNQSCINSVLVLPSYVITIHFNIMLNCMPGFSKWPLSFRFPHQNPICISLLCLVYHISNPSHPPPFDCLKSVVMKSLLTLILLTWRIWWAPTNASKWRMGFNSAFKGLMWCIKL